LDQGLADRAAEVQVVLDQGLADRVAEAPMVLDQDRADPVAAVQAVVHKGLARGLQLATMAAQLLFRAWSPALLVEPLAGAASRQKKSFSGFSER
jgi:hypothetical protein